MNNINILQDKRIIETRNSVFENEFSVGTPTPQSLITNEKSVYRVIGRHTGMGQLNDILYSGYVRPRDTLPTHRNHNRLFWTKGGHHTFYGNGNSIILEAPAEIVFDGKIGAIPFEDLTGIWQYNPETQRFVNNIDFYREKYKEIHQETEHHKTR